MTRIVVDSAIDSPPEVPLIEPPTEVIVASIAVDSATWRCSISPEAIRRARSIGSTSGKADHVDDEHECLPGLDGRRAALVAVCQRRRDLQPTAAAEAHAHKTLLPPGDDLA